MHLTDLVLIVACAAFFYGILPLAGMLARRRQWKIFRQHFDDLRLYPFLEYRNFQNPPGSVYRFTGGFESVTDTRILWIRSKTLTIPISLDNASIYLFPQSAGEPPQRIRWDHISMLTQGAKVFVGGQLQEQKGQRIFAATEEQPLIIIFYEGNDRELTPQVIQSGRYKTEYWNTITPYAVVCGAFTQLIIALFFIRRPAFRLTSITAFIAMWAPLIPFIPPGILSTILYRWMWRRSRIFRSYRDMIRLPLKYTLNNRLPNGEPYCMIRSKTCPDSVPLFIPIISTRNVPEWYIVGVDSGGPYPAEPSDCSAPYGALPGNPELMSKRYDWWALWLEVAAWILFAAGIIVNIAFIWLVLRLL
ncbi:hypothetical protein FACS1894172_01550 [Spirochaetia bacterium]|nr:hypothetical protein FACS1894164_04630 [Spirochaetia bacterium]GHU29750.1 hypothetical protein FACS1894172_01550 [Spirochaetia bacterium]